jgi:SNF2 family DNA or RNA helicase
VNRYHVPQDNYAAYRDSIIEVNRVEERCDPKLKEVFGKAKDSLVNTPVILAQPSREKFSIHLITDEFLETNEKIENASTEGSSKKDIDAANLPRNTRAKINSLNADIEAKTLEDKLENDMLFDLHDDIDLNPPKRIKKKVKPWEVSNKELLATIKPYQKVVLNKKRIAQVYISSEHDIKLGKSFMNGYDPNLFGLSDEASLAIGKKIRHYSNADPDHVELM